MHLQLVHHMRNAHTRRIVVHSGRISLTGIECMPDTSSGNLWARNVSYSSLAVGQFKCVRSMTVELAQGKMSIGQGWILNRGKMRRMDAAD
jgi:hypothetical protein